MPAARNIAGTVTTVVLFIILEGIALKMVRMGGAAQDFFFARAGHSFMAKVWGGAQNVSDYFSLRKTNAALAQENSDLMRRLASYRHLCDSLGHNGEAPSSSAGFNWLPAEVVQAGVRAEHNFLILSKGARDGVTKGSGVVSPRGVVGIVDAVSNSHCHVMSILNPAMGVSSRVGKEGAVGPLVWTGKGSRDAILKEIPLQTRFEKGDTVYTSGYSAIFPPDIPLGTLGEAKIVNGATFEISVSLFEDCKSVRYVTIVSNPDAPEMEDTQGKEG